MIQIIHQDNFIPANNLYHSKFLINPNSLELAIRICSPSLYNNDLS